MNKKYLLLIIFLLGIVILVTGCGGRDLSKPSTRLVGHWAFFEGERRTVEMYFGALDSYSVGSYIGLTGDSIYYARYRILSESEETVTIEIFIGSETSTKEYEITKDGKTMKSEGMEFQYIDSKIEP